MEEQKPVYIEALQINKIFNFKNTYIIDFLNRANGKSPTLFTLIVGNNNTGKTTLLRILGAVSSKENILEKDGEAKKYCELFFDYTKECFSDLKLIIEGNTRTINFQNSQQYSFMRLWFSSAFDERDNVGMLWSEMILPSHLLMPYSYSDAYIINAYGTNRVKGAIDISDYEKKLQSNEQRTEGLYENNTELLDAESWIRDLTAVINRGTTEAKKIARMRLAKVQKIVTDIFLSAENESTNSPKKAKRLHFDQDRNGNFVVLFETETGEKVRLRSLGSGYQSLITWVVDLAYRMFVRYPESANPLEEPAIVLVDELDLHLHPEWQRRVVGFLRKTFPKTQFIATTHSPFLVQSYPDINLIVLEKDADSQLVNIKQPENTSFEGWTIEEILKTFMLNKEEHLYSDRMSELLAVFQSALETKNRKKAENALAELEKIIEPNSTLTEILNIRLTRLPKK